MKMDKIRFEEASLDIYLVGKYNRLMDILIGDRNDIINESQEEKFLSSESLKKNENFKIKINQNEEMNQNLLVKDNKFNEINLIKTNKKTDNLEKLNKYVNFIEYLDNFTNHKAEINSNKDLKNIFFNWCFHFYSKESSDNFIIEDIKDKIHQNIDNIRNNLLIVFVDSISEIYEIINIFKTINKEFHPLFLFIMNNIENEIKINSLYEDIKKYVFTNQIKMFNLRNITIKNYIDITKNSDEKIVKSYILNIYLYLINAWFYYNNLGDDYAFKDFINQGGLNILLNEIINQNQIKQEDENKGEGLFNILMLGRPGVGKSTLINLISNSKRSMEGRGISVTKYIARYAIKKYNISLYDSPGFEFDNDVEKIKDLLEELNMHLAKKRNQIHLIFYLLSSQGGRDFYETEKIILKLLMDNQIQTFFLLTFCPDKEFGNEAKEVVEKDLKKIFYELGRNKGLLYLEKKTKIFPVHLLDEMNLSCQNFGLKTVFEEAYNQFKNYIIDDEDISKLKCYIKNYIGAIVVDKKNDNYFMTDDKQRIFDILNKKENIIYRYINDINDILDPAKEESVSCINQYSYACSILGSLGFVTLSIIKSFKKRLIVRLAENFKKVIDDEEKVVLAEMNSEKIDETTFEANIPLYSSFVNYKEIQNLGKYYMNKFEKELNEEGINGLAKYLIDLIICYNNAIKSLIEIGKNFNE